MHGLGAGAHASRRAVTLASYTGGVDELLALAVQAEESGYEDVWFADTGAPDALTLAAAVAERTRRVRIGIAVVPLYTRTPAVLAASAATLAQLAPGRFVLGLGTSSHTIIENWHGLQLERPLARVQETVQLLRGIFAGEKTDFSGATLRSRGYRQPPAQVPIYLAALGPKMLELAAALGDGVVLNLFPAPALPRIMAHIEAGAARAGKPPGATEVLCRYQVMVTDTPEKGYKALRSFLSGYYATPVYNRYLAWCGYPEAAAEIAAGWQAGDRERTAAALPDALLQEVGIIGDLQYCRQRIGEYAAGGIHTHILTCLDPDPQQHGTTLAALGGSNFLV